MANRIALRCIMPKILIFRVQQIVQVLFEGFHDCIISSSISQVGRPPPIGPFKALCRALRAFLGPNWYFYRASSVPQEGLDSFTCPLNVPIGTSNLLRGTIEVLLRN